jgi:hypothetical protein
MNIVKELIEKGRDSMRTLFVPMEQLLYLAGVIGSSLGLTYSFSKRVYASLSCSGETENLEAD